MVKIELIQEYLFKNRHNGSWKALRKNKGENKSKKNQYICGNK